MRALQEARSWLALIAPPRGPSLPLSGTVRAAPFHRWAAVIFRPSSFGQYSETAVQKPTAFSAPRDHLVTPAFGTIPHTKSLVARIQSDSHRIRFDSVNVSGCETQSVPKRGETASIAILAWHFENHLLPLDSGLQVVRGLQLL